MLPKAHQSAPETTKEIVSGLKELFVAQQLQITSYFKIKCCYLRVLINGLEEKKKAALLQAISNRKREGSKRYWQA